MLLVYQTNTFCFADDVKMSGVLESRGAHCLLTALRSRARVRLEGAPLGKEKKLLALS